MKNEAGNRREWLTLNGDFSLVLHASPCLIVKYQIEYSGLKMGQSESGRSWSKQEIQSAQNALLNAPKLLS